VTTVDDVLHLSVGIVKPGDVVSGYYVYDTVTKRPVVSNPNSGGASYSTPPYGIAVNVNNVIFRNNPQHVDFSLDVENDVNVNFGTGPVTTDLLTLNSGFCICSKAGIVVDSIWLELADDTHTALSGPAIPTSPPKIWKWRQQSDLNIYCEGELHIEANIIDFGPGLSMFTPVVSITPNSGTFLSTQQFDAAVRITGTDVASAIVKEVTFDGDNITNDFHRYQTVENVNANSIAFQVPRVRLPVGAHTLKVTVELANSRTVTTSATYHVLSATPRGSSAADLQLSQEQIAMPDPGLDLSN
jgi:hypothetical protein